MNNETKPDPAVFTGYNISPIVRADLEKRFNYHAPFGNQAERYAAIRLKVLELAIFIGERAPTSRELSSALTHLDAVMFYTNAAIARNEANR